MVSFSLSTSFLWGQQEKVRFWNQVARAWRNSKQEMKSGNLVGTWNVRRNSGRKKTTTSEQELERRWRRKKQRHKERQKKYRREGKGLWFVALVCSYVFWVVVGWGLVEYARIREGPSLNSKCFPEGAMTISSVLLGSFFFFSAWPLRPSTTPLQQLIFILLRANGTPSFFAPCSCGCFFMGLLGM